MNSVSFPSDYQQVMPYLIIPHPEAFLNFAKEVLGATEKMITHKDDGSFGHCEIVVGSSVIMFSVTMEGFPARPGGFFVYVTDADTAYEKALQHGATSLMPVTDQPYGRSGGVLDTNGNTWWLTVAP